MDSTAIIMLSSLAFAITLGVTVMQLTKGAADKKKDHIVKNPPKLSSLNRWIQYGKI